MKNLIKVFFLICAMIIVCICLVASAGSILKAFGLAASLYTDLTVYRRIGWLVTGVCTGSVSFMAMGYLSGSLNSIVKQLEGKK